MDTFHRAVFSALQQLQHKGKLPETCDFSKVSVEPAQNPQHGDFSTNAPLVLARQGGGSPHSIGAALIEVLRQDTSLVPLVLSLDLAGAGFINVRFHTPYWHNQLRAILNQKENFGRFSFGAGRPINVEYVSGNPTGPLHAGHGRVAVVADVLANLLEWVGFSVTREYYINDCGGQVDVLARSTYLRYCEALGQPIEQIPEGYYPGDYLKEVAQALVTQEGDRWLHQAESAWGPLFRDFAVDFLMTQIKADLKELGICQEIFSSELALHRAGKIEEAVQLLKNKDLVYEGTLPPPKGKKGEDWEAEPLLLFRSTQFGDDVDRPLKKSTQEWTYFAADIAYHLDKFRRGFPHMINVWGADHGSHVKRMQAAVQAITENQAQLSVILCQMVNFMDQGIPVKMSKRSGTFITLKEVTERVGKDVFRFMMLTRKPDAHFDFDFAKACEQTKDNPVFYVQYAYARSCSVFRMAQQMFPENFSLNGALQTQNIPLEFLDDPDELALVKMMTDWPRQLAQAAQSFEPHRLASFLYTLASAFHGLWSKGTKNSVLRFLVPEQKPVSLARLAMIQALVFIIGSGLQIFGVEPVQEMR